MSDTLSTRFIASLKETPRVNLAITKFIARVGHRGVIGNLSISKRSTEYLPGDVCAG